MKCELCKIEAGITGSRMEVCGDKSADEQTEVYTLLTFACRNKQCAKSGQTVGEERIKVFPDA